MPLYLIIIFSIYFIFLLICFWGWHCKRYQPALTHTRKYCTVIIPVRNEAANIRALLESLVKQDYPQDYWSAIIIDDHSTDDTIKIIDNFVRDNQINNVIIRHAAGDGKKNAITEAMALAEGEIILTTDGDCLLPPNWISCMQASFLSSTSMVVGLVRLQPNKFFGKLQAIEFASLIGVSRSLLKLGIPVMSNGASLAYTRKSFLAVDGYKGNEQVRSGDDEFLMCKLNQQFPGTVKPVDHFCVVETAPQINMTSFMHQRIRWASKWKWNTDYFSKILAVFTAVFNVTNLACWILLFLTYWPWLIAVLIFLKFIMEGIYIQQVSYDTRSYFSWPLVFLLQIIYPFYLLFISIRSQIGSYLWKGRTS